MTCACQQFRRDDKMHITPCGAHAEWMRRETQEAESVPGGTASYIQKLERLVVALVMEQYPSWRVWSSGA